MNEQDLRKAGQDLIVGEDLYAVSTQQLQLRLNILNADVARTKLALAKKRRELSGAENIFRKS